MSSLSSNSPSGEERRRSFRCLTLGPGRFGYLSCGDRQLPVEVLDQSADGAAVLLETQVEWDVNWTLCLDTESIRAEVRVANRCVETESEPTDPPSETPAVRIRLGLQRLRDLEPWELAAVPGGNSIEVLKEYLRQSAGKIGGAVVILLILAAIAVVLLGGSNETPERPVRNAATLPALKLPEAAAEPAAETRIGPGTRETRDSGPESDVVRSTPGPADPLPMAAGAGTASKSSGGSARPSVPAWVTRPQDFLHSGVADALSLSSDQRQQLQRITDEFRTAASSGSGAAAAVLDNAAGNELVRRSLGVLTDAQRQNWQRVQQAVHRMSRPDAFLGSQITDMLSLSAGQRRQLQQLADEYGRAVGLGRGGPASSTSSPLDSQMAQRALSVLTDDQRGSWVQHLAKTALSEGGGK